MKKLEVHVTELAELSSIEVLQAIRRREEGKQWTASFDGFYQTSGQYSNNSSGTIMSTQHYVTGQREALDILMEQSLTCLMSCWRRWVSDPGADY